jgi:hypothetical protein
VLLRFLALCRRVAQNSVGKGIAVTGLICIGILIFAENGWTLDKDPLSRFLNSIGRHDINLVTVNVPAIGCAREGQVGPLPAPQHPKTVKVTIPGDTVGLLAVYFVDEAAANRGVLAPKGWNCFGIYGSSGSTLYVTPVLLSASILRRPAELRDSPVVALNWASGETSGRFAVAETAARLFPRARPFVELIQREGIFDSTDWKFFSWPQDILTYLSDLTATYITPPATHGLGTRLLNPSPDLPTSGLVELDGFAPNQFNLRHLAIRLPIADQHLSSAIIVATITRQEFSKPTSTARDNDAGIAVVTEFYNALGRADGRTASQMVAREKRASGNFSANSITRFYSRLHEPLRLISATAIDETTVHARYRFKSLRHSVCNGEAVVHLRREQDGLLIERIRTFSGC